MTTEETKNELIPLSQIKPIEVFSAEKGLDPIIDEIKKKVNAEVYDVTTAAGRARMRSVARQIGSSKKRLEEMGKDLTEGWRKQTKAVTSETTRMTKELDALRDAVKKPAEEFDAINDRRVAAHEERLAAMTNTANFEGFTAPTAEELNKAIGTLKLLYTVAFDDSPQAWEEFADRADKTNAETLAKLNGMLEARIKADKEAAELKRLQDEEAERKAQAERDRIAKEAAENARLEAEEKAAKEAAEAKAAAQAEQDRVQAEKDAADKAAKEANQARIDAEIKAESDRQEAAERERKAKVQAEEDRVAAEKKATADKEAAVQAERKRQEDEAAAKAAADSAREADKTHRAKIYNEALLGIQSCKIGENDARQILDAIREGRVPNVKLNF